MTEQVISPMRRRMIEDMSTRKFAAKTQHDYVQRVKDFAAFLGRCPDTAESEDVRRFRLHLTSMVRGVVDGDEDAEAFPADQPYWEERASKATLTNVDEF